MNEGRQKQIPPHGLGLVLESCDIVLASLAAGHFLLLAPELEKCIA